MNLKLVNFMNLILKAVKTKKEHKIMSAKKLGTSEVQVHPISKNETTP